MLFSGINRQGKNNERTITQRKAIIIFLKGGSMKVEYDMIIYYCVKCPECGSEIQIDNEYGTDLTDTKIECPSCGEKIKITGQGETIYM